MSRKALIVCPGSGSSVPVPTHSNPKVDCPRCGKRVGVHSGGKVRKHEAFIQVKR
jgi:ribosomal protein S27E